MFAEGTKNLHATCNKTAYKCDFKTKLIAIKDRIKFLETGYIHVCTKRPLKGCHAEQPRHIVS